MFTIALVIAIKVVVRYRRELSGRSKQLTRQPLRKSWIDYGLSDEREDLPSLFQQSSVGKRAEFTAGLFEGALVRCVSEPLSCPESLLMDSEPRAKRKGIHQRPESPQALNDQCLPGKGKARSTEEELVIWLRKEQN